MTRRQALALTLALAGLSASPAHAADLTVFAAASLTDVLRSIAAQWQQTGNAAPRLNFAASSTLARQLEQGAAANLFASADEQWMNWVDTRNLLAPDTRIALLGNSLAVVAPAGAAGKTEPGMPDLRALLGPTGRLAIGDPASVPAGIYARQALTTLGVWSQLEPRLARADSVRSALQLVSRGEAAAGIVYLTDAAADQGVRIIGHVPPTTHDRIVYPFAILKAGDTAVARAFLAFLAGPQARKIFEAAGFVRLEGP